ncbi:MAG: hypothetical protein E4G96_03810 [Chrysiogenales bacterium]|nr:MAG: hypothetical protein E4G96_03810 [Chrysiogenales bacterium]
MPHGSAVRKGKLDYLLFHALAAFNPLLRVFRRFEMIGEIFLVAFTAFLRRPQPAQEPVKNISGNVAAGDESPSPLYSLDDLDGAPVGGTFILTGSMQRARPRTFAPMSPRTLILSPDFDRTKRRSPFINRTLTAHCHSRVHA